MDFITQLTKLGQNKDANDGKLSKSKTLNNQNNQRIPEIKKAETLPVDGNMKQRSVNVNLKNLITHILDDQLDEVEKQPHPETIRVKNNVLLILLIISAYGVYYLIGEFLDVLLIAYMAGIAYHQSKGSFTSFITDAQTYNGENKPFPKRLLKALLWLIIGLAFPRIRYLLSHPHKIQSFPSLWDYLYSLQKSHSYIVIVCQIFIGVYILYLLIGPYLKRIGQKIRPTNIKCVQMMFALLTVLVVVGLVVIIPTVLFQEISSVGSLIQKKVQKNLGCELIYHKDDNSTQQAQVSQLPLCTDKFTNQNTFLRQTIREFQQQNKTLEDCLIFLQKLQEDYLGEFMSNHPSIQRAFYDYSEVACTWYSFIDKAIKYSGITISTDSDNLHTVVLSTGSNIFKLFFGNLTWILSSISNSLFNLTTFITTFMLTIKYYSNDNTIKEIFSENKQELISSITNLIQATFFIVIEHFILSVLLLQIFGITPFNLIISTMLASMALFPFVRPWFGVLVVTGIRMLIYQEYYISVMFIVLYYVLSQKIYSIHYRKMEMHEIVTNMSVLFGIYQFGVAGIIYGPLIIITYQCVQRQLFKKYPIQHNQNGQTYS